ncbi:MAG: hypothetical protein M1828_004711 [Chrysothrix sp. TS-e1954]|nr:MAG: hypothetical protein M1828_004711 [Chrysothrix sp. TS-e1954]
MASPPSSSSRRARQASQRSAAKYALSDRTNQTLPEPPTFETWRTAADGELKTPTTKRRRLNGPERSVVSPQQDVEDVSSHESAGENGKRHPNERKRRGQDDADERSEHEKVVTALEEHATLSLRSGRKLLDPTKSLAAASKTPTPTNGSERSPFTLRSHRRRRNRTDNTGGASEEEEEIAVDHTPAASSKRASRRRRNQTDNISNDADAIGDVHAPTATQRSRRESSNLVAAKSTIDTAGPSPSTRSRRSLNNRTDNISNGVDGDSEHHEPTEPHDQMNYSSPVPHELHPSNKSQDDDILLPSHQFRNLRKATLSRLTSRSPIPLTSTHQPLLKTLRHLSHQTIQEGESNSLVLTGARGSGKSALVNQVLEEARQDGGTRDAFHVVRLNGVVQIDTRLALREILRQLGREIQGDVEEDEDEDTQMQQPTNDADALSTLLAMLTHTPEPATSNSLANSDTVDQIDAAPTDTQVEIPKSLIILLDNFHLFTQHPRQTLLYNLFNLASTNSASRSSFQPTSTQPNSMLTSHATGVPLLIIGMTPELSPADLLEKRVKSRFSSRTLYLPLPPSYDALEEICRNALTCHAESANSHDLPSRLRQLHEKEAIPSSSMTAWNQTTSALLADPKIQSTLHRIHATSNSPAASLTSLFLPISRLQPPTTDTPSANTHSITSALENYNALLPPTPLHQLTSLSTLQLALLICVARLEILHSPSRSTTTTAYATSRTKATTAFNLPTTYAHYTSLITSTRIYASTAAASTLSSSSNYPSSANFADIKANTSIPATIGNRPFSAQVARTAWEGLISSRLLVPLNPSTSSSSSGGGRGAGGGAGSGNGRAGGATSTESYRSEASLSELGIALSEGETPGLVRWCRV